VRLHPATPCTAAALHAGLRLHGRAGHLAARPLPDGRAREAQAPLTAAAGPCAQDLDGLTSRFHAAVSPGPAPAPGAPAPALLLALRPGSPGAAAPGSDAARAGARTASRLPWVLGADAGLQGPREHRVDAASAAAGCAADAGAAVPAPVSPVGACRLRTCSDDEDLEVSRARETPRLGLPARAACNCGNRARRPQRQRWPLWTRRPCRSPVTPTARASAAKRSVTGSECE